MRKVLITIFLSMFLSLSAQSHYKSSWSLGGGYLEQSDDYLSQLPYKGYVVNLRNTNREFYKKNENLSWLNRNTISYGDTYNPAMSSLMRYASLTVEYGTFYHFNPVKNFVVMVGGLAKIEAGGKLVPNNFNNIGSVDASFDISPAVSLFYKWDISEKFAIDINYELYTPLIGTRFAPEWGMSYYDLYTYNLWDKAIAFTSLHNSQAAVGDLNIDLLMKGITLRLGFEHTNKYWNANGLKYSKSAYIGSIGFVFDINLKSGK